MRKEDLYLSIGSLDDDLIERSERGAVKGVKGVSLPGRLSVRGIGVFCAACAAVAVLIAGLAGAGVLRTKPTDVNDPKFVQGSAGSQESVIADGAYDTDTAVRYGDLKFGDGAADENIMGAFKGASSDIAAFDESMLGDCEGIVEGEIKNIYLKNYSYDVFDNKFGDNKTLKQKVSTVIYEILVDKVWYGSKFEDKTVLIEDQMLMIDEIFVLKKGHRYVIPFYKTEDKIFTGIHYAGGDIDRDSSYSTVYSFHPQIEVTQDGRYVVSDDWETLSRGMKKIVVDEDTSSYSDGFYRDKMRILAADVFEERMQELVRKYVGNIIFNRKN